MRRPRPANEGAAAAGLAREVEALRRERPAEALALLRRGFAGAVRGAGAAQRGELWRLRGHVLRALGHAASAVTCYRHADRWYARAGAVGERGRTTIGRLDALMYLGRYAEARAIARAGRGWLARAGEHAALARLRNNEGNLHHRLDRPDRALACYRDAERGLRRGGDARSAAMIEGNVANVLALLGRTREARARYRHAMGAHERLGHPLDALQADYSLAYLDFLEHRHERALERFAGVRDAAGARHARPLVALCALDRAEVLLRLGAHAEAVREAVAAAGEFRGLQLGYEGAKAELFAALGEYRLARPAAARRRLERSLAVFHREGNRVWTGEALVGLSTIEWSEAGAGSARPLLAAAARCFAAAADPERRGASLALLARADIETGRIDDARRSLAGARRAARRRSSPRLRHLLWASEAAVALRTGRLAAARAALERAARVSEQLATRILDEQWRASFWGEWGWPHAELAKLELRAGRVEAAFEALERGRGRALLASAPRGGGRPLPEAARAWAAGRLARDRERSTRGGLPVPETVRAARDPDRGAGAAWLRRSPPRVRLAQVRRALAAGTTVVDYARLGDRLAAIVVRPDGLHADASMAGIAEVERLVQRTLFHLRSRSMRPQQTGADAATADALTELASWVLWPLVPALRPGRDTRALLVVPAGPLARVPWAALPLPDGRPLCAVMPVVVAPGLRLALGAGARPAAGRPLVVAYDSGDLAHVANEVEHLRGCFPDAEVLAGTEATAARFLERAPHASWIHVAGHGAFDARDAGRMGLRLADRWLLAEELEGLRLRAEWVTLSACHTARALVEPGEEWFGLVRTLLAAGAGAVLAAQWDVDDGATAALMAGVYGRVSRGIPVASALALTQAEQFAQGRHPLDWSGFVLLGGPHAIAPTRISGMEAAA